jgi:hypothetical protein
MAEPLVGQGLSNTGTGGGLPQGQSPNPAQDVGGGLTQGGNTNSSLPVRRCRPWRNATETIVLVRHRPHQRETTPGSLSGRCRRRVGARAQAKSRRDQDAETHEPLTFCRFDH